MLRESPVSALFKFMRTCAVILLLGACGGTDWRLQIGYHGNGIESPPYLPPAGTGVTVDVAAAWRHYLGAQRRWEISGVQNGSAFTLALERRAGPDRFFPDSAQLLQTTGEALRLRVDGVASDEVDNTLYYQNDSLIGIVFNAGNGAGPTRCAVTRTLSPPLRGIAKVGDSGIVALFDSLNDCKPGATPVGTVELRWSIRQDLAVTLFCLTTLGYDGAAALAAAHTGCVQTTATGELGDGARLSLRRPDGSDIGGKNY